MADRSFTRTMHNDDAPLLDTRSLDQRAHLVATMAVAVAGAAAAVPTVAILDAGIAREARVALPICSALLSGLLARWVLRSQTPGSAAIGSVLGGAIFGALNAGAVISVGALAQGRPGEAILGFFGGCLLGAVFAAPIGLAFGAAFAPVLAAAVRARRQPSHDALEPLMLSVGGLLALAGAAMRARTEIVPGEIGLALIVAGLACASLALVRDVSRLRWTRRVRATEVAGFRVVATIEAPPAAGLIPIFATPRASDGVLVWAPTGLTAAPYRCEERPTALATVDLGSAPERRVHLRIAIACLVVVVAAGVGIVSPVARPGARSGLGIPSMGSALPLHE